MVEPPLIIECPVCLAPAQVQAVQGDRCAGCGFEFKRFSAGEGQLAADYFSVLTGDKKMLELPDGHGWLVAHE